MLTLAIISGLVLSLGVIAIATSFHTTRSPRRAVGLSFLLLCNMLIPGLICSVSVYTLVKNHARPTKASLFSHIESAVRQPDRASILSALKAPEIYAHVVEGSYFHHDTWEPRIADFSEAELARSTSSIYLITKSVRRQPCRLFANDQSLLAEFLFDADQHLIAWHHRLASEL